MRKERRDWRTLRSMSEKELKDEWKKFSLEAEQMSKWVGVVEGDEFDLYMDKFGNLLEDLHGLRTATELMYHNNSD